MGEIRQDKGERGVEEHGGDWYSYNTFFDSPSSECGPALVGGHDIN